jgi:galactonate dehydratase
VPWRKEITDEQLHFEDGYMTIPDKPGLGIELHEDAAIQHPYVPHDLRHYNGQLIQIRPPAAEFYF